MRIESRITVEAMNSRFENVTKFCLCMRVVENRDHTKNGNDDDEGIFDTPKDILQ
jgi:hypothetical protein